MKQIIGLFGKIALSKRQYSAKETCNSKEPTNRSHPIVVNTMRLAALYTWVVTMKQTIGLFCKRALSKRQYSAKETCNSKEPTHRSHSIVVNTMRLAALYT